MAIISISLSESLLKELDEIQNGMGFSGRSEVIRAGVKALASENDQMARLKGKIKCILLLVHKEKAEDAVSRMTHEFKEIIEMQIHSNLQEDKCLEIFVLNGESERIRKMLKIPEVNKKLEYFKLIVP